jgi:hypothetical protein
LDWLRIKLEAAENSVFSTDKKEEILKLSKEHLNGFKEIKIT